MHVNELRIRVFESLQDMLVSTLHSIPYPDLKTKNWLEKHKIHLHIQSVICYSRKCPENRNLMKWHVSESVAWVDRVRVGVESDASGGSLATAVFQACC